MSNHDSFTLLLNYYSYAELMMGSDCPFQFPCSGQIIKYVNWKPFNLYSIIHKSCKFTVENVVLALYPHFHICN